MALNSHFAPIFLQLRNEKTVFLGLVIVLYIYIKDIISPFVHSNTSYNQAFMSEQLIFSL
jgi:hypothetical protein